MTVAELQLTEQWQTLLMGIPGYDPFTQAGECWFDEDAAQLAMDFFPECLTHIKGPKTGEAFILEEWQRSIIANLFGWKRPDGTRRYRELFLLVPRKNGKTPFAAGMVLNCMLCDDEGGAEIYSAAADAKQAKLVFNWAKGMVKKHEGLNSRCRIYQNSIVEIVPGTTEDTGTFYQPISADAFTKHGYNTHMYVVDEVHAQPDGELMEVLETSTAARSQPLGVYITTQDYLRESACNEKYDYACKVRDNIIEDMSLLPVIYEASRDDDWTSPDVWAKANPNLGVSVSMDYIISKCKKAQDSPSFENTFKRLHLNIQTEQDVRWLSMEKWDNCTDLIDLEDLKGALCYGAMDLATVSDIACYMRLFPLEDGRFVFAPRFYVPKDNAFKREKKDRVPYATWARQGFITLTPGDVIDYSFIKEDLKKDWADYDMQALAFDRWNFEALRQQFMAEGIPADKMISFGQGFVSLSAPSKELEKLIISGKMIHNNNPVMRWMASNVSAEIDASGNIKPSKKKSSEKIDGILAAIMALGQAITQLEKAPSIYKTRGLLDL
jgi:phage terminase large subunit-like protein